MRAVVKWRLFVCWENEHKMGDYSRNELPLTNKKYLLSIFVVPFKRPYACVCIYTYIFFFEIPFKREESFYAWLEGKLIRLTVQVGTANIAYNVSLFAASVSHEVKNYSDSHRWHYWLVVVGFVNSRRYSNQCDFCNQIESCTMFFLEKYKNKINHTDIKINVIPWNQQRRLSINKSRWCYIFFFMLNEYELML